MRETLRLFRLAAAYGSFKEVSKRCMISPRDVEGQIRGMEIRMGTSLLCCGKDGCTPTAAGWYLYEHSQELLPMLDKLISDTIHIAHQENFQFYVGCAQGYNSPELGRALRKFEDNHPRLEVRQVYSTAANLMDSLRTGKVDVVVCGSNEYYMQEFAGRAMASVPCYVELSNTDPAAWKSGMELESLKSRMAVAIGDPKEQREIQCRYRDALGLHGKVSLVEDEETARKYLAESGGYRLIESSRPEQSKGFIQVRLLREAVPVSISHHIFWQRDDDRREVHEFGNQLRSVFAPELRAKEGTKRI